MNNKYHHRSKKYYRRHNFSAYNSKDLFTVLFDEDSYKTQQNDKEEEISLFDQSDDQENV